MNQPVSPALYRQRRFLLVIFTVSITILLALTALSPARGAPLLTPTVEPEQTKTAYCQGVYIDDTSTGTNQISTYGCRPDWPETGPEHYYRFQVAQSQPVTLTLSYGSDIDLDLFLLENGDPNTCDYADATLHIPSLEQGDYVIVVDGYEESQGPYSLEVDCTGPPLASPTPTTTPLATSTPTATIQPSPSPTPTATPPRPHLTYYTYLPNQHQRYPPPTPYPTTLILQQGVDGYAGAVDSYLNAWATSTNYANVDRLSLRQSDVMAPIIRFQLDNLPPDAHIVEATLSFWVLTRTNDNPATTGVYRLNRPWDVSEVTWNDTTETELWFVPGANGTPGDRDATPYNVVQVGETGIWYDWNVTSLVQEWLRTPDSNYGVILKAIDVPKVHYALASSDYHNKEARPKLTIRYWTPASAQAQGS